MKKKKTSTSRKPSARRSRAASTADILSPASVTPHAVPRAEVPKKWSKHYRRLLSLREDLLRRRGELAEDASQEQPACSMHMADSGTDSYDRDFALSLLSSDQNSLYEIDEAIKRIESGTYGVCELTGETISNDRLSAIPWTRFSVRAQQQLEKNGDIRKAQLGALGSLPRGSGPEVGVTEETEEEPD